MPESCEIIDTHVHVVAEDREAYPLNPAGLPGAWYLEAPYSVEAFTDCMDAAGVAKAILVQPVGAYSFDNRYTADAAASYPQRFASACCIDVNGADPAALTDLVAFDNLYLKITTHLLNTVVEKGHSPAQWVEHLVRHFGADRLMWGSDFSQTHNASYAELVDFARQAFSGLSEKDRNLCMGGTAASVWPSLRAGLNVD